ncbi:MAG: glycoside hydrolase family 99-like domain-containing protein [Lachnospiraceae bacterium]|nr:glycoside hydrolase family 99-like domain-containing protein [Lachnospiraceae bacterium]
MNSNTDVKMIAFHLPQFHTFPENDEWWGKGFTEWTNTRKAEKLFQKHNQPREPYNDNYYDLSNLDSMLWQMNLAKKYGVYGFCYYHYWFKDGKLLLHKPLELIRDYSGEKLPYCLCWANEPWTRAWEGNTKKVLMPQEYGNEAEWEDHFNYLLTFFRDPSYICVDNKPMLVLYRCNNIPRCDEMIAYWENKCREEGFSGLHLVEEMNCYQEKSVCKNSAAILEFEPLYTMSYGCSIVERVKNKIYSIVFNMRHKTNTRIYHYEWLWNSILKRNHTDSKKRYLGGFVDWDNTARKGRNGRIVLGVTPERFEYYLDKQKEIAAELESEFVFVNAWNEWGEGTYLEPDKKNGFKYLEAVLRIFGKGTD